MTAPTLPTKTAKALRIPTGIKMPNGYQTLIICNTNPNIAFFEKQVKPPGIDGGDMIDTTTMLNQVLRTHYPRSLVDTTPITGTAGYDPIVLTEIIAVANTLQSWTIWFPNGGALVVWAALNKFELQELNGDGTFPEAQFTLTLSNSDTNQIECLPQYYTPSGTDIAV